MGNIPKITKNLLVINILVLILMRIDRTGWLNEYFVLYPVGYGLFRPWQLLTYMFMHANFWHLFFNMYSLFIFGSVLENTWGPKKFLIFYLVCGIGAALVNLGVFALMPHTAAGTVGASGAIYGVLLGYAMLYPDSRLTLLFPPVTLTAKWFVIIFAVIELLCGVLGTNDGIAHFAHLGGMLFALMMIFYWKKRHSLYEYER
ncbi:MAG: rhomboid family intramembrane serine protease [Bacteroidales bacterium]|nr:rhomboid family intramembrane serine protease [Bacteroidales bacterium]